MVKQFKKIFRDILYISKISRTKKKKYYIFITVVLSQIIAFIDILIIAIFAAILTDQFTSAPLINTILDIFIKYRFLIVLIVVLRFVCQYLQKTISYRMELNVNKNLKIYVLNKVFEKRNFSVADSYYFVNIITTHASYFFSSFTSFLNNLLQIFVFAAYLFITNLFTVLIFFIGSVILFFPIKSIIKKARKYMHETYESGQEANKEVERVIDNLILIKILGKDKDEVNRFSNIAEKYIFNLFNNFKYGVVNSLLPNFFTLFLLTLAIAISNIVNKLSLDFIGITLRLFQSLGNLTTSMNQIINSHVHIEKFYELEVDENVLRSKNYKILENSKYGMKNVSFKYLNSDNFIFENLTFDIPKNTHTAITGPNGSGKSTLLGLLAGFYYSNKGHVFSFSKNLAYVSASPLIFSSTIYENVMYGNKNKPNISEIIELLKYLETFKESKNYNLDKFISNKTLSSGQMQKIAFVRAFISNPEILLLDEATSNLDENSKDRIFELLMKKNITIINSTHDIKNFRKVDINLKIKLNNEKRHIEIENFS